MVRAESTARLPLWFRDLHGWAAAALYLVVVLFIDRAAVEHLGTVCACSSSADPTVWMWTWTWIPHALLHGENPIFTNKIWTPRPYDLAATTWAPVTAIPGAPLTALFGPIAAYSLLSFAAPVVNGWAAYRLIRYVSGAPLASILGGWIFAFSTFELGHMLGHMNLLFVFSAPLLILVVLRYLDGEITRVKAVIFATILLLIEFGLSTEILLDMTYLGAVALVCGYLFAPEYRPRLIQSGITLVIAYVVTGVICSYYLYEAFRVPSYAKGSGAYYPADLLSYVFPTDMFRLGGNRFLSLTNLFLPADAAEQNNYIGLPLCLVLLGVAFGSWRLRATKIVILTTLVAFILSLGSTLTVAGQKSFNLPFDVLVKLPLFDLTLPSRLGLFVTLGAAMTLALWMSWAGTRIQRIWRWLVALLAVAFLIPNAGFPGREASFIRPTFFTHGIYKHYLKPNEVVLPIPWAYLGTEMLWQRDADMYFKTAGGYFGAIPPSYASLPIAAQLLTVPGPTAAADLRSFVRSYHVGATLIQDGLAGAWPQALTAAGWHEEADVGGIQVWKQLRSRSRSRSS